MQKEFCYANSQNFKDKRKRQEKKVDPLPLKNVIIG